MPVNRRFLIVSRRSGVASALLVLAAAMAVPRVAHAERFTWTLANDSAITTKLTATYSGISSSDTKTTGVAGTLGGVLGLPAFDYSSILIDQADVGYTSNPTFNIAFSFLGGATITTDGLGFALPGPNGKSTIPTSAAPVDLTGAFTQGDTGVEGRGTLHYTGTGLAGPTIGSGTINLVDLSPIPGTISGTLTQVGNQIRLTTPIALDQSSTLSNGVTVRAQVSGTIISNTTTTAGGWKTDAGGSFSTAASWSSGVAPASGTSIDTAVFGNVITAPRTILSTGASVRSVIVSSSQPYTLLGTLSVSDGIDIRSGTGHSLTAVNAGGGPFSLNAAAGASASVPQLDGTGAVSKTGDGTFTLGNADVQSLTVNAGHVVVASKLRVHAAPSVPGTAGQLDLASGKLEAVYGGGGAAATLFLVRGEIRDGYDAGAFDGAGGIVSSAIAPGSGKAIGYADRDTLPAASYGGVAAPSSVVATVTLSGDADLDYTVDFNDLLRLAKHYGTAGYWSDGDFDYSGTVDFTDLLSLAKNYNRTAGSAAAEATLPASVAGDWALAQSLVPEPTSLATLVLGTVLFRRRR